MVMLRSRDSLTKMAAGPREAIQTLSSLLFEMGFPKTPSEVFRQAKFNHPSAYSDILELIYRLIPVMSLINTMGPHSALPSTNQIKSVIPKMLPSKEWMLLTVQKFFYRLGYSCIHFYNDCNSRELLLALSWVVCKTNTMETLKLCTMQSARRSLLPVDQSINALLVKIQHEYTENTKELLQNKPMETYDYFQALVFTNGRIFDQLKKLERLAATYKKLDQKVQSYSEASRMGVYEAYLLTHSEAYSSCMRHLESHASLLVLLLKWEMVAGVFQKWIDSVLELKEKELIDSPSTIPGGGELRQRVDELQRKISCLIKDNECYIESVKKLRISENSERITAQLIANDSLVVALKGLKYNYCISDIDRLRTRMGSLMDDMSISNERPSITELEKEVERKQLMVLSELLTLQDSVPDSISVNSSSNCIF